MDANDTKTTEQRFDASDEVLTHLRAIRADMAEMAKYMREVRQQLTAMGKKLDTLSSLSTIDQSEFDALKERLALIEQRLGLMGNLSASQKPGRLQ